MTASTIIFIITIAAGFYMAWNIGANDVANAMGTSVGSGALSLKQAVIVAGILEFAGAFFLGSHVTETVRKGMIDPTIFAHSPEILMFGMLSALLAAGVWLQIATYFGWPVSTTHTIVGAVVGFAVVGGGFASVNWGKIGQIVASWVISPLMSGILAFLIFQYIKTKILNVRDSVAALQKRAPYLTGAVFLVMSLVMLFKGMSNLPLDLPLSESLLISLGVGIVAGVISRFLIKRISQSQVRARFLENQAMAGQENLQVARQLHKVLERLDQIEKSPTPQITNRLSNVRSDINTLIGDIETEAFTEVEDDYGKDLLYVERVFGYLQILSACFVAFAHGANDVANSIGPLAAVVSILRSGSVSATVGVPIWLLGLGGIGIVIGLATWGWRVIETVGRKITELTPTRGFAAEFGAATTIVLASRVGLPISTTHTLVGAVFGVGMARGMVSLDLNVVRNIVISWLITVPAGAVLAIFFFELIRFVF